MNLANKLTLSRICLVPVFVVLVSINIPYGDYIAAAVFILAASTDGLDGYIARKNKMVTNLGKFMDPLADKLLVSAALISLVELKGLAAWIVVIIISREFIVTGLRSILAVEGVVVAASRLGKLKTVTQILAIIFFLINDFPFSLLNIPAGIITMGIALIFTVWSGADYLIKYAKYLDN